MHAQEGYVACLFVCVCVCVSVTTLVATLLDFSNFPSLPPPTNYGAHANTVKCTAGLRDYQHTCSGGLQYLFVFFSV